MSAPYELEISTPLDLCPFLFSDGMYCSTERACDGDTLDQARAFEIYDKVAVEGSEGYSIPPLPLQSCVSDNFNLARNSWPKQ